MRKRLLALSLIVLTSSPALADSTVSALSAGTTLVGSLLYLDQGGSADRKLGLDTSLFAISAGNLTLNTLPVTSGGTGITSFGAGIGTWLGTPSSANLAAAITDETGSGALVFGTAPAIAGGSLSGTFSGTPTLSGNLTFSGVPLFTGLSAGTQTKCLGLDSGNQVVYTASGCGTSSGVTSVGLSVPATSIFGVTGTPVTTTGTLGLTTTGASGGIPYFSSSTAISSSAALTANQIVLGGGAATTPASLGSLGTTTTLLHGNAGGAPTFAAVSLTADVSGNLPVTNLNSGTSASSSTFWRGDGTWATPAGGSVSITAATPNIVVTPSPLTGTGTVGTTVTLDTQSGNSAYTIVSADNTKAVTRTNTVTQTDIIPQATGSFASGFAFGYSTATVGNLLTATTSTVNGITGATGIKVGAQQEIGCNSDGTNWACLLGLPQPATQTGTTILQDDMTWAATTGSGSYVRATSATMVTPTIGAATATSVNKVALTAPASSATLTIADGKTLTDTSAVGAVALKGATGGGFAAAANNDLPAVTTGSGTTHSLTGPREYWYCTGTCTVTPPVPVAGYEFCVADKTGTSGAITMAALGSSAQYPKTDSSAFGTAGTGTMVSTAAAGSKICLVGLDSTHYELGSYAGTWTVN